MGVKDFENQAGWSGRWKLGYNLGIMLESALYDSGRFVLVEREKLKTVLSEQDLAASGRTAKANKVAKTGLIRSARYIATGAITEVEESQSGGDGGFRIKNLRIGGGKSEAHVALALIVKLIDTTTGELAAKKRIVGKAGKSNLRLGLNLKGFGGNLGGFKKTPLGQAAQDAINKASTFIAKEMETFPFEGSVIKVASSGQVIINRGSKYGVEEGQLLTIEEAGEVLLDPETGEILDQEEGEIISTLRVSKVKEKVAYCEVVDGDTDPSPGTVVRAK